VCWGSTCTRCASRWPGRASSTSTDTRKTSSVAYHRVGGGPPTRRSSPSRLNS
jgi:hypothetical protein